MMYRAARRSSSRARAARAATLRKGNNSVAVKSVVLLGMLPSMLIAMLAVIMLIAIIVTLV